MTGARVEHKDLIPITGDGPNETTPVTVTPTTTSTWLEQQWRNVAHDKVDKTFPQSLNLDDSHVS